MKLALYTIAGHTCGISQTNREDRYISDQYAQELLRMGVPLIDTGTSSDEIDTLELPKINLAHGDVLFCPSIYCLDGITAVNIARYLHENLDKDGLATVSVEYLQRIPCVFQRNGFIIRRDMCEFYSDLTQEQLNISQDIMHA